jgi:Ni,Fe-hydrogenase maturation factor
MVGRLLHFRKVNDLLAYGSQVTDDTINVLAMSVIQTAVGGLITDELEEPVDKVALRIEL